MREKTKRKNIPDTIVRPRVVMVVVGGSHVLTCAGGGCGGGCVCNDGGHGVMWLS